MGLAATGSFVAQSGVAFGLIALLGYPLESLSLDVDPSAFRHCLCPHATEPTEIRAILSEEERKKTS